MRSSVCRARAAGEHSTSSGSMPSARRWRAMAFAARRPRPLSGRSWSRRSGSFQLDFAWRSRYRRFTSGPSSSVLILGCQRMHDHHHDHSHGVSPDSDIRLLAVALALNAGFMVVEVVAGALANSLALLSDAAHMLTDTGAIALALVAARLAQRRAKEAMTFGFKRAEILSAQVNGLTLVILAGFIVYEGTRRLVSPPDVDA